MNAIASAIQNTISISLFNRGLDRKFSFSPEDLADADEVEIE